MKEQNDDIYKKIQEAISSLPENFSVLEEQIDVELQMEYFNYGRELKREFTVEYILEHQSDLFNPEVPVEEKKSLLVLLAAIDKVEAFRAIEKYVRNPDPELKDWSVLALQESRMLMQSSLLDEQQVFISTGLGGKGQKLRYFAVFIANDYTVQFTEAQKKLLASELKFSVEQHEGELEEIRFEEGFAVSLLLLPVKVPIQDIFKSVIDECNQIGNFIREDIIITNVRKLTLDEIKEFINQPNQEEEEEEDDEE
jgi:hypothetical protein